MPFLFNSNLLPVDVLSTKKKNNNFLNSRTMYTTSKKISPKSIRPCYNITIDNSKWVINTPLIFKVRYLEIQLTSSIKSCFSSPTVKFWFRVSRSYETRVWELRLSSRQCYFYQSYKFNYFSFVIFPTFLVRDDLLVYLWFRTN